MLHSILNIETFSCVYELDSLKVESSERNAWAEKLANENSGFFINQFGNADKAEEYHESELSDGILNIQNITSLFPKLYLKNIFMSTYCKHRTSNSYILFSRKLSEGVIECVSRSI